MNLFHFVLIIQYDLNCPDVAKLIMLPIKINLNRIEMADIAILFY